MIIGDDNFHVVCSPLTFLIFLLFRILCFCYYCRIYQKNLLIRAFGDHFAQRVYNFLYISGCDGIGKTRLMAEKEGRVSWIAAYGKDP